MGIFIGLAVRKWSNPHPPVIARHEAIPNFTEQPCKSSLYSSRLLRTWQWRIF